MGCFDWKVCEGDGVRRCGRARNVLHTEGAAYLLHRMFAPFGDAEPFSLGIAGATTGWPQRRPDPFASLPITPELTLADFVAGQPNEGGAYKPGHAALLGYARQSVTFEAQTESGGAHVATGEVSFENALDWLPTPDSVYEGQDPPEVPPHPYQQYPWVPNHAFPWSIPRLRPGHLGTVDDVPIWPAIEENLHRGASFPVSMLFVCTATRLIASAFFVAPLVIRPGQTLAVRYTARLYP